ncbi:MAG: iron complex outerrane recepter protein [Methylobacteriaceae bacterium]|nr:iron complex outerrane recepter protein [Methylobacteriaceae bacterium]
METEVARPRAVARVGGGTRARASGARRVAVRRSPQQQVVPSVEASAASTTTEPAPNVGMDRAKIPANVQVVTSQDIERTGTSNLIEVLDRRLSSVSVTDSAGNPFQATVTYRGFAASPVPGTPQGLAVYQNGMRINEAFGDVVNWDLIPTNAIDRAVVFTNNPVFGLNALGGAISLEMKNGFTYQGTEIDFRGGSRGRAQASLQSGQQIGNFATYIAAEAINDNGYRKFSPSYVGRLYGDLGYRAEDVELHLNVGSASNFFGATAPVPIQLLQQDYSAVYTSPQTTRNVLGQIALNGTYNVTPTLALQGNIYFRGFSQNHLDGNTSDFVPCNDGSGLLCDPSGNQTSLPDVFGTATLGSLDRTFTRSRRAGGTLQATSSEKIAEHGNQFIFGLSYDRGWTQFNAISELGIIQPNLVVSSTGLVINEPASDISPVSLRAINTYYGVYALDTFDIMPALTLTAGARYNLAKIELQDQIGTALTSFASYGRINPVTGLTFKILPNLSIYGGYSEANRAPTPLENGCADRARPCLIDNFLVADPPLKQVVARTIEAGIRGNFDVSLFGKGKINWNAGLFRTNNQDDILNVPSMIAGRGFFENAGNTRRQGVEAGISYTDDKLSAYANYALVDATFRSNIQLASPFNPVADANGNINVVPGDRLPSIPRNRIKVGCDYFLTDKWKVGADASFVGSSYLRGDEINLLPKIPAYQVVNLRTSYQIDKNVQVYGIVENLLDRRYATFGTLFDTQAIGFLPFTDPRTVSPAQPFSAYVGVKAKF